MRDISDPEDVGRLYREHRESASPHRDDVGACAHWSVKTAKRYTDTHADSPIAKYGRPQDVKPLWGWIKIR